MPNADGVVEIQKLSRPASGGLDWCCSSEAVLISTPILFAPGMVSPWNGWNSDIFVRGYE